jgi:uncharacterized membrane-anchored protein YhcB (DUF1043 family)
MWWDLFIGSVITATGAGLVSGVVWFAKILISFRKENREDHDKVMRELKNLKKSIDVVGERMTSHIEWHLKKR